MSLRSFANDTLAFFVLLYSADLTPSRVETHKSTKIYLYKTSEARKDDDSRENVTEKAT